MPAGCTEGTLESIARMVCQTGARRLCVLGDLFHDATSLSADVRASVEHFFEGHQNLEILLVRGNHDQRVGRLPKQWPIREVDEGEREGNVWLGHYPIEAVPDSVLYLCGHVHPAIRIGTRQESLGVFPCFWLSQGCLVLPAIGEFTGTHRIDPSAEDQVWAVVEDQVIPHHRSSGKVGSGQ